MICLFFFLFFLFSFHWFSFRLSIWIIYLFEKRFLIFLFHFFKKLNFLVLNLFYLFIFWLACNLHRHFSSSPVRTIWSARSIGFHPLVSPLHPFIFQILNFGLTSFYSARFFSSLLLSIHPTLSPSIGSSLLVASPDVAEFERLRSRLNESQTQTRYLQSMVNIRDQELDRARKVSCHVSFVSLFFFFLISLSRERNKRASSKESARPFQKECLFLNFICKSTSHYKWFKLIESSSNTSNEWNVIFFFTCLEKKKFKSPGNIFFFKL